MDSHLHLHWLNAVTACNSNSNQWVINCNWLLCLSDCNGVDIMLYIDSAGALTHMNYRYIMDFTRDLLGALQHAEKTLVCIMTYFKLWLPIISGLVSWQWYQFCYSVATFDINFVILQQRIGLATFADDVAIQWNLRDTEEIHINDLSNVCYHSGSTNFSSVFM